MKTWLLCLAQCLASDCAAATFNISQTVPKFPIRLAVPLGDPAGSRPLQGAATAAAVADCLLVSLAERANTSPDRTPLMIRTLRATRLGNGLSPETAAVLTMLGSPAVRTPGMPLAGAVLVSASAQGDQQVSLIGIGQHERRRLAGADLPGGLPAFVRTVHWRANGLGAEPSRP